MLQEIDIVTLTALSAIEVALEVPARHKVPAPILYIRHGCLWQFIGEEGGMVHERVVAP